MEAYHGPGYRIDSVPALLRNPNCGYETVTHNIAQVLAGADERELATDAQVAVEPFRDLLKQESDWTVDDQVRKLEEESGEKFWLMRATSGSVTPLAIIGHNPQIYWGVPRLPTHEAMRASNERLQEVGVDGRTAVSGLMRVCATEGVYDDMGSHTRTWAYDAMAHVFGPRTLNTILPMATPTPLSQQFSPSRFNAQELPVVVIYDAPGVEPRVLRSVTAYGFAGSPLPRPYQEADRK